VYEISLHIITYGCVTEIWALGLAVEVGCKKPIFRRTKKLLENLRSQILVFKGFFYEKL